MTKAFKWGLRSAHELEGIHQDLLTVCNEALALSPVDFMIIDGLRTIREQRHYVAIGTSHTMKSRHLHGFAVDFVPFINGQISWDNKDFLPVANAFQDAARARRIPIIRGYDWPNHWDAGHIELDYQTYPDPDAPVEA